MKIIKDKFFSIRTGALFVDLPLEFDVYLSVGGNFVLFRKKHDIITTDRMKSLLEHRLREVYVPIEQKEDFLKSLQRMRNNGSLSKEIRAKFIKESAFIHFHELYTKPDVSEIIKDSKNLIKEIVNFVSADLEAASSLMKLSTHDYYTYNHSVNVSVYCIAIAKKVIGENESALMTMGLGGFFHDLGKRKIDEAIITKPGKLSPEEWEQMKKHPEYGLKLLENVHEISDEVRRIVYEHHENVDGSGYPQGITGDKISKYSKIASIADVFDALTSDRYYKKAVSAIEALKIMNSMQPGKFDESIFRTFDLDENIGVGSKNQKTNLTRNDNLAENGN